jgi:FkbH-like protein
MYESEINSRVESDDQIPADVLQAFSASRQTISMRTVLPWGEHCVECVAPTCFSTCDLYEARPGGKCRRFTDGMVRIDTSSALSGYLLKIRFKRWGMLWADGNIHLHSDLEAQRIEIRDQRIGIAIQTLILPSSLRFHAARKRYLQKKSTAQNARPTAKKPSSFLVECYNPGATTIHVSLTVTSRTPARKFPYQALLEMKPGFNRIRIAYQDISAMVSLEEAFEIQLVPNDVVDGTTLYFGTLEFVYEAAVPQQKAQKVPKIKCVVWDLDNTLWDGVLVEDSPSRLRLKPGIREVIEELDRRGVLQSVASKNNHAEAMDVLKSFNLADYFLFPQISWSPKSESVASIVQQMNIGADTVLFIDDSPFELEQVRSVLPDIRVFHADEYRNLLSRPEFDLPVTEESASRRKMYQTETERQVVAQNFGEDYKAFLRHCEIRVTLSSMTSQNLERVHELTQRTNQMNFSGNRYDRQRLAEILQTSHLDTYVIKCEDKFGSYGVVGFALVDKREPRLTDLMFSCRIQSKRVEHALLAHIVDKYTSAAEPNFFANYKKTSRNEPSGRVFADMGFQESGLVDGVSFLTVTREAVSSDDHVIQIVEEFESSTLEPHLAALTNHQPEPTPLEQL